MQDRIESDRTLSSGNDDNHRDASVPRRTITSTSSKRKRKSQICSAKAHKRKGAGN